MQFGSLGRVSSRIFIGFRKLRNLEWRTDNAITNSSVNRRKELKRIAIASEASGKSISGTLFVSSWMLHSTSSTCRIFWWVMDAHLPAIAKNAIVDFHSTLTDGFTRFLCSLCCHSLGRFMAVLFAFPHKNLIPFNALICCCVPAVAKSVHTSLKTWQ